ncbi:MAG TPA: cation:proton antiporter [Ferrovibrio sp.]|uniref:cation:proton antiporter domain-containing protein n=1 Tax=Ferrovibrio sp. TaxID=1917215 RepID=UPI002ED5953B
MEHDTGIPYLRELVVFLAAAGIVVPIFQRLRVSPVLGFLVVGFLIGPNGLALFADRLPWLGFVTIGDIEGVRLLAEFGIIFLLFMIGLEMSLQKLWQMKRLVLGLGLAQIVATAVGIAGVAELFGNPASAAVILGACLSLSSTAIVMQLLIESRRSATQVGRASFAILLMQDLAVVPILFLVSVLATLENGGGASELAWRLGETLAIAAGTVALIVLIGRRLLGPLFRSVGAARSPELFMALTLLVAIGMAMATNAVGLSFALGAFLAGMLLAESEYRHAVEVSIEPFKGLLLGLFFISVGMGIDVRLELSQIGLVLLSVAGLFLLKGGIIGGLALAFGFSRAAALEIGFLLGQGGEFAFVVIALASRLELLAPEVAAFMLLVTSLSMLATPPVARLAQRAAKRLESRTASDRLGVAQAEPHEDHVLICGFGRVGQTVARLLDAEEIPWLALDFNAVNVAEHRGRGRPVHFGDASRIELLARLDADKASALVVTLDDPAATRQLVATAHRHWPKLAIFARARDRQQVEILRQAGAKGVIAEAVETSLQLGALALSQAGLPEDAVLARLDRVRTALAGQHGRPDERD